MDYGLQGFNLNRFCINREQLARYRLIQPKGRSCSGYEQALKTKIELSCCLWLRRFMLFVHSLKRKGQTMKKILFFLCAFAFSTFSIADDAADVEAVIHQYINSETLDLSEQTKLMASDRTYITNGIRFTNNEKSMAIQTAGNDVLRRARPGIKRIATVEDIMVRVNGNSAVSSFYRSINTSSGVEGVRAGQSPMNTNYQTGTMVLFKINGDWKIVHTHYSPTK